MAGHDVEAIKRGSARLRGSLRAGLADPLSAGLGEDDRVLLKFHGSYQQDDRDVREDRRRRKLEPAHAFMIRTRTPGGVLRPSQWLTLDAIARRHAERGLRITTRQALQLHGVPKHELQATMQALHATTLDTIAACGDVNRNIVVTTQAPAALHARLLAQARELSAHLLPRTRAWYEIWLDAAPTAGSGHEEEPIYGEAYLPRKFKIGFALPPGNDVDVFAQDLGFIAIVDAAGELRGYDVTIGGGMGASHGDAQTYPRLGDVLGGIRPDQLVAVTTAIVTTQRDAGNRSERKRARLKYTLDDRGLAWFRAEVERRAGFALAPAHGGAFSDHGDRFGWHADADGAWNLGLRIPAGRVRNDAGTAWQDGLRAAVAFLHETGHPRAHLRLTANQNLVLAGIEAAWREPLDALLAGHGIDLHRRASRLRLHALACVALPTCGLAMAEAERYLPAFATHLEAMLARHGLADAPIHLRISGCPNGCSRPYLGEIALVGRGPGRYNLMLGADHRGQRLNTLHGDNLDEAQILAALEPLLARYAGERGADERFGDFLVRAGIVHSPRPSIPMQVLA